MVLILGSIIAFDSDGNIFGTTSSGGKAHAGTVYKVDTACNYAVLYSFTGGTNGAFPYAGVTLDGAGNLYGTAISGGASGQGVVYKLNSAGLQTVLYSFTGGPDGAQPYAGVTIDAPGNLYGTTTSGGAGYAGVVYKLDVTGRYSVLHGFTGGKDGGQPYAGVTLDAAGDLSGTTQYGGSANEGAVFKMDVNGRYTVLHNFMGGWDGRQPTAGAIPDLAGNLFGATYYGGAANAGVIFKLDAAGNETVLYAFPGREDGSYPLGDVTRDSVASLYGTAFRGGKNSGIVYKLKQP